MTREDFRFDSEANFYCIPIAASRIFCDGGFGAGFVCNQYSEKEM